MANTKQILFLEELQKEMIEAEQNPAVNGDGAAFEYVVAEKIYNWEQIWDRDPTNNGFSVGDWGGKNDLGIDLWFTSHSEKKILAVQCKYDSKPKAIKEADIDHFYSTPKKLIDKKYVYENANENLQARLENLQEELKDGYTIELRFVTTSKSSKKIKDIVKKHEQTLQNEFGEIISLPLTVQDLTEFKNYCNQAASMHDPIPKVVTFEIAKDRLLNVQNTKDGDNDYLIGVISGRGLFNLYKEKGHRAALFTTNVRHSLGNTKINKNIQSTIITPKSNDKDPVIAEYQKYFFHFNNGITALCTDYTVDKNKITAENFQIINGAQTTSAIVKAFERADAYELNTDDVEVLIRLLKTDGVDTKDGINARIIEYTNTQNVVKKSDFKSNDTIQDYLFQKLRVPNGPHPFYYQPKRGVKVSPKPKGTKVELQDLAKMRYAYLFTDNLYSESHGGSGPHQIWESNGLDKLWTDISEGGFYEICFGIDGKYEDMWGPEYIDETKFIVLLQSHIIKDLKDTPIDSKQTPWVNMQYHILNLVAENLNLRNTEGRKRITELINFKSDPEGTAFNEAIKDTLVSVKLAVRNAWGNSQNLEEEKRPSAYAFKQNGKWWTEIRDLHKVLQ